MTLAILFDSVGVGEWFVLLAVILIVVGPKRLPSTARKVGQYYSKFRRAADSFKRQLLDMDTEFTNTVRDATREVQDAVVDIDRELEAAASGDAEPSPRPVDAESLPRLKAEESDHIGRDEDIASTGRGEDTASTGRDEDIASTGRDEDIASTGRGEDTASTSDAPEDHQS